VSNSKPSTLANTEAAPERTRSAMPSIATELRRRRELLGWSQAEAARRSGMSRTVINEIESGRRVPQTRTYEKLRGALGLAMPAAPALLRRPEPESHTERQLAMLAACLLTGRGGTLAALAEATGVSIVAVREELSFLSDRLATVGLAAVDDGDEVRLFPQSWAADAVSRVTTLEVQRALTDEAVKVMVIIGMLGTPTRREIEERRGGQDCANLLDRMCRRGLIAKARDDTLPGDPNTYRLTAVALGAMGHATLESFQAWFGRATTDRSLLDDVHPATSPDQSLHAGAAGIESASDIVRPLVRQHRAQFPE
jgi:chromosome segregation and condensation protein ScpB/DNA-binding XRE family transcriptional regulator